LALLNSSLLNVIACSLPGGNKLFTGRVHHSPYQLRKVEVTHADPGLFALDGFETPVGPPVNALYSERVDVSIYSMDLVDPAGLSL